MVVLSTLGYIGAAVCAVGWLCRKMFSRSFGTHDESNEEDVTGKLVLSFCAIMQLRLVLSMIVFHIEISSFEKPFYVLF